MIAKEMQSHGFATRAGWKQFFDEYNESVHALNQMGYDLLQTELPLEEWLESYREYSNENRRTYLRMETLLEYHIRYFTNAPYHWTKETADALLAYLYENVKRMEDLECAYMAANSLTEFYLERDESPALAACCAVKAVCLTFLDPIHMKEELWQECSRGIRYYEEFFHEMSKEEQKLGLTLYDVAFHLLSSLLGREDSNDSMALSSSLECFYAGKEAERRVLENNPSMELDRNIPSFDRCLAFGALILLPEQCSRSQAELILRASCHADRRISVAVSQTYPGVEISRRIVRFMAERLVGERKEEEICSLIDEFLNQNQSMLFCVNEKIDQEMIDAVENVYLASKNLWRSREQEPCFQRVLRFYADFFTMLSYSSYYNYVSSTHIYRYICSGLKYLEEEDILHFLLRMAGYRQVQTVMHSIMVSKLAVTVVEGMLDGKPELLVGQLSTKSAGEVQGKREELLNFIREGALLHDIGKIACSSIINAQYRRVSRIGYRVIQCHPVGGGELLSNLPRLSAYHDIAIGHHKSFDGRTGYPKEYDHTQSPIRIFIDVISLCDSLDAATDQLGRNYAAAKNFDQVLQEMRQGRNTRYCGELVDLIQDSSVLQLQLRSLLDQGRHETYYEVHKLIRSQLKYENRK